MHGRLKIKTTAEQAEEKRKEREEKRKTYVNLFNHALQMNDPSTSQEFFKASTQVLCVNPDLSTFWNHRRKLILTFDKTEIETLLQDELTLTKMSLTKNPKSYCAWHHRTWVFSQHPNPPWDKEMALCDQYLKLDERNFHCWDHRRFVVKGSNRSSKEELEVSKDLIERNFSNYSAWHYRSKLLPEIHPPDAKTPHPISEVSLVEELKMVVEAVFTDPSDQSPWFFLRWLINKKLPQKWIVHATASTSVDGDVSKIVCIFNKEVKVSELPEVVVNGIDYTSIWTTPFPQLYSPVWVTTVKLDAVPVNVIELKISGVSSMVNFNIPISSNGKMIRQLDDDFNQLSDLTTKTLTEIKENCTSLDELDPNNKWVLLTLVDVLWALDYRQHKSSIINYLVQLENLDPLRQYYYRDIRSKLKMKIALDEQLKQPNNIEFSVSNSEITRLYDAHHLASFSKIDLSHNLLTSIQPCYMLVLCKEINLSGNEGLADISPLYHLSSLEILILNGCAIKCDLMVTGLGSITTLNKLDLKSNPICLEPEKLKNIRVKLSYINDLEL